MSYLRCDGNVTTNLDDSPACSTGWLIVPDSSIESIFQSISIQDSLEITGAIILLWSIAFGIRLLIHTTLTNKPGRY